LSRFPPNGFQQQSAVEAIKSEDAYNWGYDPVHYLAPEGSYAVNPYARVKEYRSMVQALHEAGLRVIQDQVFNHTHASGQADNSVLDKIVPGYYYRLDEEGTVLNASCCSDTASEHKMMEKLMVDCLLQNARHYKIDGFRFDLMGFHYLSNMLKIRAALPEHIYLYGEGWQCDETSHDVAQPNATQASLYGSGIGSFNDRIRDGIRGGGPYADQRAPGFVTGNYGQGDWIRAGLAGNLRDFVFTDRVSDYNGEPVGYTASAVECVNYCSVHDNQTLFDAIQMKAPLTDDAATRARRHMLALSFIALAQGIPFFHAGDELLRSKDMDNNSYNSGDWFNKLDFSYQSNNWGTGLPLATENQKYWPIMRPLLANPALKPSPADIIRTRDAFEALLRVRTSSGLFRMRTLKEVQSNLRFLDAEPGVIVMRLAANSQRYDGYQQVLVVFNATKGSIRWDTEGLSPHPAMQATGTDTPALATAVFVG
jgi:pullulanase